MKSLLTCLFALVSAVAPHAQAVIVEGNFRGTVAIFTNGNADWGWGKYWDDVGDVPYGSEVTGSFWYDTDKAPADWMNSPTRAEYRSETDTWLGTSFSVAGKTFNVSDYQPAADNSDSVEGVGLSSEYWDANTQLFSVFDDASDGYPWNRMSRAFIEVVTTNSPLLNGLGLVQEFDWTMDNARGFYGQAEFTALHIGEQDSRYIDVWVDVSELSVRVKKSVSVPESSPLLLLCFGVAALAIKRSQGRLRQS